MERFVTVRVVQAWGLDLARFQFDGELTIAVMFLDADGTVYGRYGSRGGKEAERWLSVPGLAKAMEGALELHALGAEGRKGLSGKVGKAPPWRTPEAMPAWEGRPNVAPADGSRGRCVHCHQANDGEAWSLRMARKKVPDRLVWAWPMPDAVGLALDPDERATVRAVATGSAAEKAGFRAGDRILAMEGQRVLSIADVQWVLHTADAPGPVEAEVLRGEATEKITLALAADWRRGGDWTWRVLVWSVRHRLLGTEPLVVADAAERKALDIADGRMALRVKGFPPDWVKEKAKSDLEAGDVIVEVDGRSDLGTESLLLAYLFREVPPGGKATLTVLRNGKRETVPIKMRW
ncbi:MAG: PDZ domain-containing protein [Planctomycetes bacterium]|nr:PDZ domain-containing protein [Planctomycetota bacterium]